VIADFFAANSNLLVSITLNALLALSLYLPLMAGQLSLASPGFFAVGGYVAAIVSTRVLQTAGGAYPLSLVLLEFVVAVLACGILAIIVGIPSLRLRGIYLALATIALVEVLRVVSLNLEITGGAVGIFGVPQPFADQAGYLFLTVPFLLATMWFLYRLERGRVGRAFLAIREDELAADAMGINPTYYKVLAFTLGAMLAGGVGVIAAHSVNTWNARQGTFDAGVAYLAFVLIGGSRTFVGPVLGAVVLTALPEILRPLQDMRLIVNGLLLTIGAVYLPQGIVNPDLFKRRPRPKPSVPRGEGA
jgi:branched-chain amino acid transport system permease protein